MKICPRCSRTYADDDLNFCLDDGSVLKPSGGEGAIPETVLLNQLRTTDSNQTLETRQTRQTAWKNPAQYTMQPKKNSHPWLWAIGVLGFAVLLCGGGFVGFLAWLGSLEANTNSAENSNYGIANVPVKSPTPDDRTDVQRIDLKDWVIKNSEFGTTEYAGGELVMRSSKKGFYYVLIATQKYKTDSATAKVTVKNVEQAPTDLGFGLIVHSGPVPLRQDYAFLIDSVKKRYRVVYHQPSKEIPAVNWTDSSAIRGAGGENTLEVRDTAGKMEFFINGDLVTALKNVYGYKGGVAGIYAGDAIPIAFTNLEIRK